MKKQENGNRDTLNYVQVQNWAWVQENLEMSMKILKAGFGSGETIRKENVFLMEQLREGMFSNVVNVAVDIRMEGFFQVEDIHCVRCNKPLGWRSVRTYLDKEKKKKVLFSKHRFLRSRMELFCLSWLIFCFGTEQGLLNADTLLDPMVDQEDQADHDQEDQGFQGEEDEDDQGPDDNVDID
ncbi:hypothetical protein CK203_070474 [Vitis vinifera]|uniref:Yippee domain-containing protein n=1 Tax=Vitis vinifera TaxID=29760 RepID=A0A438FAU8_VITVI|nr:hypothetical protein CK203_070474 [Vitis vinifera]